MSRWWQLLALLAVAGLAGCGDDEAETAGLSQHPPEIVRPVAAQQTARAAPDDAGTAAATTGDRAPADPAVAAPAGSEIDVDRLMHDPAYLEQVARRPAPSSPPANAKPRPAPAAPDLDAHRPDLGNLPIDATEGGARSREFDMEKARKDMAKAEKDPYATESFFNDVREFQEQHMDPNATPGAEVPALPGGSPRRPPASAPPDATH